MTEPRLTAVIPAYNESQGLQETLRRLDRAMREICAPDAYEVLVIDDGSTDGSFDRLELPARVRVLRHAENRGYGASLKTGIRDARHPSIVICDADGTYPVEELPRLVRAHGPGSLVVAERATIWYPRWGWLKRSLRAAFRLWLLVLTGRWIPDINSGFRLFPKEPAAAALDQLSDRFSFTTSLTLLWIYERRPVVYVPVSYAMRKGESKVSFGRDGWRVLRQTICLAARHRPGRLAALVIVAAAFAVLLLGFDKI